MNMEGIFELCMSVMLKAVGLTVVGELAVRLCGEPQRSMLRLRPGLCCTAGNAGSGAGGGNAGSLEAV